MFEFSGLAISGIGVIHDLLRTYGTIGDYSWSWESEVATRELRGTHEVVIAFNETKKVKYRIRQGESSIVMRKLAGERGRS
jgi:hypothetical protein